MPEPPERHDLTPIPFAADRLLLVGTGAVSVSMLPFWLNWFREIYPAVKLKLVLTASAQRLVSADALAAIAQSDVLTDAWPTDGRLRALHVELAQWSDLVLVYPATLHFVSRFALGLVDTPVLLALQSFAGLVGVAPAMPPDAVRSPAVTRHLEALRADPRVVLAPTKDQRSVTTGRVGAGGLAPLPELLSLVQARRAGL